jgi:hypothetical protein
MGGFDTDELYRPGRGWGKEWTPAEANLKS